MKVCVLVMGLLLMVAPLFAQDSLVCIAPSTARYYLEVEDEMYILREKDSISNQIIQNYSEVVLTKDRIIRTYELDTELYSQYIDTQEEMILLTQTELDAANREVRKQKRIKWLVVIGAVAGLLLL